MKIKTNKDRLDRVLVLRGLAATRAKAQALILAGQVFNEQQRLDKAGLLVPLDLPLMIKEPL
ncbi:MAG: S4 domain-containing protein, partial [Acidobacteriota bacterium]|nr:S4 domain-containing protein [Acidobacteriota bacterium]